ncbi:Hpt domain-containing protein [Andreprevotia lacus DSM 23236]|jgi:CheY-like chemotaxis protein|uniref:Hpt domain-containing protein n=1 Tax=Andreprevotia lacus DSM 23236 TaxID=1121001 RepID=A0A1W1X6T7_9NEIS|nr:response regulator [Andreprevotia lacus]SMC19652.1 Hpt domain-containing protein [Andreprevotia lacus DSM 23236]
MPTPAYTQLVLVVDDSLVNRTLLEHWLSAARAKVLQAATLEQARALLALHRPTHLIVDMHLPDGEGSTLYAEYHSTQPGRWIASTMPDGPAHLAQIKAGGFADVLVKPIAQAQLLSLIQPVESGAPPATAGSHLDDASPYDPVLDFDEALRRLDGDAALFALLANSYLEESAELPQRLRQLWLNKEHGPLSRLAHTAGGLSGQFGLLALRKRLLLLEYSLRNPDIDPRLIDALLDGIDSAYRIGIPALREALQRQGSTRGTPW